MGREPGGYCGVSKKAIFLLFREPLPTICRFSLMPFASVRIQPAVLVSASDPRRTHRGRPQNVLRAALSDPTVARDLLTSRLPGSRTNPAPSGRVRLGSRRVRPVHPPGEPPPGQRSPGQRSPGARALSGEHPPGAGPYSAAMRRTLPVLASSVSVLAPGMVVTVCSTANVGGPFFAVVSLMTVSVPSPCELKHSSVLGLNAAPSQPRPIGRSASYLPSRASSITMACGFRQATNRT